MERDRRGSIQFIESKRNRVTQVLDSNASEKLKLIELSEYLLLVLDAPQPSVQEAYINELITDYIFLLHTYDPRYVSPQITSNIISIAAKLSVSEVCSNHKAQLNDGIEKLQIKLAELQNLITNNHAIQSGNKIFFPVLELSADFEGTQFGLLETISVQIRKADSQTKFRLIPGEINKDILIEKQVNIAWKFALKKTKPFISKIEKQHEVFIHFDTATGFYRGNSLGTAMTLMFIDRLLNFYNSHTSVTPNGRISFTGGIDEQGRILNTSPEIIKKKVEITFYSDMQIFCVPKDEEQLAIEALVKLKEKYPKRDLKIIGVESVDEILDRRMIVTIKKLNPFKRTAKFVLRNWSGILTAILLAVVSTYIFSQDFDDNPTNFSVDGNTIFIKNKNGKVLWKKGFFLGPYPPSNPRELSNKIMIFDSNNDDKNEVFVAGENNGKTNFNGLNCYYYNGRLKWTHRFTDSAYSHREIMETDYSTSILDTITIENHLCFALFSSSLRSFASAIYFIDVKTNQRKHGTFWNSGHVIGGMIRDINNDNKKDIMALGYDNGYEDVAFFAYEINDEKRVRLTTDQYLIRNYPIGEMLFYIRIKKTDYDILNNYRMPPIGANTLRYDEYTKRYYLGSPINKETDHSKIEYALSEDFRVVDITVASNFRIIRDSLVAKGILQEPYTDTRAFKENIIGNIMYLKNGKWIKHKDLDQMSNN